MKALIIGAGFVGRELAGQLIAHGHESTLLDPVPPHSGNLPFRRLDVLADPVHLPDGTDAVFYLAQSPHYREFPKHAGHLFGVNTLGAIKAAEAAASVGCRFFFYASTGNVYSPSFHSLSEKDPSEAPVAYARSKRMAEQALALFSGAMSVCVGRIFGVFGPGQKHMLPALIRDRLRKREAIQLAPHPDKGHDGGLHVSFIFNADLGRILVHLAEKAMDGEALPPILNLGGSQSVALEHLAKAMGTVLGIQPMFERIETPRTFDLTADISLLRRIVDVHCTPLHEAIKNTLV